MQYLLYILRWAAFAIPGAFLLDKIQGLLPFSLYPSMIISQALLGGMVGYWIDRLIFKIKKGE